MHPRKEGLFLVRESTSSPGTYVLCVWYVRPGGEGAELMKWHTLCVVIATKSSNLSSSSGNEIDETAATSSRTERRKSTPKNSLQLST